MAITPRDALYLVVWCGHPRGPTVRRSFRLVVGKGEPIDVPRNFISRQPRVTITR